MVGRLGSRLPARSGQPRSCVQHERCRRWCSKTGVWQRKVSIIRLLHPKDLNEFFVCFSDGFFAAASFMSFQQCRFNFGSEPFRFPPQGRQFDSFNGHAQLKAQDKIVLPRHIFLDQLRKLSVREDSCTLCFDAKGIIRIEPCKHR